MAPTCAEEHAKEHQYHFYRPVYSCTRAQTVMPFRVSGTGETRSDRDISSGRLLPLPDLRAKGFMGYLVNMIKVIDSFVFSLHRSVVFRRPSRNRLVEDILEKNHTTFLEAQCFRRCFSDGSTWCLVISWPTNLHSIEVIKRDSLHPFICGRPSKATNSAPLALFLERNIEIYVRLRIGGIAISQHLPRLTAT